MGSHPRRRYHCTPEPMCTPLAFAPLRLSTCSWLLGLTLQMEVHERIGDPYQFIHQYRRHDRVRPSAPLAPENVGLRRKIVHAPVDVAVSLLHGSLGFRYPHPLVRLLDIDPLDALCRSYPHGSWLSFVRRTCVYRMFCAMQLQLTSAEHCVGMSICLLCHQFV